jgi:integrase
VQRKNAATVVKRSQAARLKKTSTPIERSRVHDQLHVERDELLMCLLIEHGLRVSEIVNLNEESIDIEEGTIHVKRSKNYSQSTLKLMPGTRTAAVRYLPLLETYRATLAEGNENADLEHPLFYGYEGKRITRFGIYDRVRELGKQAGVKDLSPHVLRNYWVQDAFRL